MLSHGLSGGLSNPNLAVKEYASGSQWMYQLAYEEYAGDTEAAELQDQDRGIIKRIAHSRAALLRSLRLPEKILSRPGVALQR